MPESQLLYLATETAAGRGSSNRNDVPLPYWKRHHCATLIETLEFMDETKT